MRDLHPLMTREELMRLLSYEPQSGVLTWKVTPPRGKVSAGDEAGSKSSGRVQIKIKGRIYKAHRLAWLFVHGAWPIGDIDHKNGNPLDNRLENLRDVPHAINQQNLRRANKNNLTGLLGVRRDLPKYRAEITVNGLVKRLGSFDTPEEAHAAYLLAKRGLHEGCTI